MRSSSRTTAASHLPAKVAALPGVESVDSMSFLFGGLSDPSGKELDFALEFVGSFRPSGVRLVDGRATDPTNEHEFVATRSFVRRSSAEDRRRVEPRDADAGAVPQRLRPLAIRRGRVCRSRWSASSTVPRNSTTAHH